MKVMILAAGLGTRLRPLTNSTPKALILVNGQPLIVYSLKLLQKYGIRDVVINLHHLGDLIEKELGDGSKFDMKITYSWESTILGTAGGIKKAVRPYPNEPFFVLNSDILIDLNLKQLFQYHQKKKGIATMVLRPRETDSPHTPILTGRGDRILKIGETSAETTCGEATPLMYTGAQVLEPALLQYIPENRESCLIKEGYQPALRDKQKIYGFRYMGYWNDIGTLDRYRQVENDLSQGKVSLSYVAQ